MNFKPYEIVVSVKGLRKPITIDLAYTDSQMKTVVKSIFPGLAKEWHARLAIAAKREVERQQLAWKATADTAMQRLERRNFEVSDYRVAAVGCDAFSTSEKDRLRKICAKTNLASSAARAHQLAATSKDLAALEKRYAEGLA